MRMTKMKKFFVIFFALLFVVSMVSLAGAITLSPEEVEVITLVNEERALLGLDPLYHNAQLSEAAARHSEDMFTNEFFAHVGSDGSTFDQRILEAGYTGSPKTECIASGFPTAEDVVEAWMGSPGHYAALMLDDADRIGVGLESGYWTVDLGTGGSIDSVPIPATLWLLGSGLVGLLGMRRKLNNPSENI